MTGAGSEGRLRRGVRRLRCLDWHVVGSVVGLVVMVVNPEGLPMVTRVLVSVCFVYVVANAVWDRVPPRRLRKGAQGRHLRRD